APAGSARRGAEYVQGAFPRAADRPGRGGVPESFVERRRPDRLVQGARGGTNLTANGVRIRDHGAQRLGPKKGGQRGPNCRRRRLREWALQRKGKTGISAGGPFAPRSPEHRRPLLCRTKSRVQ